MRMVAPKAQDRKPVAKLHVHPESGPSIMLTPVSAPMKFELDTKYQITHAWYQELLASAQLLSQEPRAQDLQFKPDEKRLIVEIGVYEGASTCWWSDNLMDHPESRLISIDPFTGNEEYQREREKFPTLDSIEYIARSNAAKSKNAGKIDIRRGCSWDLFPSIAAEFNGKIDILYIDGEHTSNAVCRDISLYAPLLRSGGALILDDYGHEDVQRGVDSALTAFGEISTAFKTNWQLWCVKK